MYCPNCGKKVNDYDNFCKFCGRDLRENLEDNSSDDFDYGQRNSFSADENGQIENPFEEHYQTDCMLKTEDTAELNVSDDEEIVVYEIKKHYMALFWPCVFSPVFLAYFWIFYVNIPSFLGFLIALIFITPIVYPILRYYSDRIVITTSNIHIHQGVFNSEDISIPLKNIHLIKLKRSFIGNIADYGHLLIRRNKSDKEISYRYIQNPDEVEFILTNPFSYINKYLNK